MRPQRDPLPLLLKMAICEPRCGNQICWCFDLGLPSFQNRNKFLLFLSHPVVFVTQIRTVSSYLVPLLLQALLLGTNFKMSRAVCVPWVRGFMRTCPSLHWYSLLSPLLCCPGCPSWLPLRNSPSEAGIRLHVHMYPISPQTLSHHVRLGGNKEIGL